MKTPRVVRVALPVMTLAAMTAAASPVRAQSTTAELVVRTDINPIVIGDVLLVTGRSEGTFAVGDCAPGDPHVQMAVIVDPADGG